MSSKKPQQLPSRSTISMVDFNALCATRPRYEEPERALYFCAHGIEDTPQLEQQNPFEYWREKEGYSKQEMAGLIGVDLQYYCDIEEGEVEPSVRFIEDFCCFMDIHPLRLYFNDTMGAALLDILLKSYDKPDDLSVLMPENRELRAILIQHANAENSYNFIEREYTNKKSSEKLEDIVISRILEKLLVNDGNPLFSGYGCLNFFESEIQKMTDKIVSSGRQYRRHTTAAKVLGEALDKKGEFVYGKNWPAYNKFIQSSIKKFGGGKSARSTLDLLVLAKNNLSKGFVDEIFGTSVSLYRMKEKLCIAGNTLKLSQRKLDTVREFLYDFEGILRDYDNRQTIIRCTNDLDIKSFGVPNHPSYMVDVLSEFETRKLMSSSDIKLLPPPRPI